MPFHYRLIGEKRIAPYSFIHSLNTSFGVSIYEPIGVILATTQFANARSKVSLGTKITENAQTVIQNIINEGADDLPRNKLEDLERIRSVCRLGDEKTAKATKVDLCFEDKTGGIYCFDLKTAKPNIGNFKEFRRTLLEWCAIYLREFPDADIHTLIAIPYNSYDPVSYDRLTLKSVLDVPEELKVAAEFWDFLGGDGAYLDILDCFERIGNELKSELDAYFAKFEQSQLLSLPQSEPVLDFDSEL